MSWEKLGLNGSKLPVNYVKVDDFLFLKALSSGFSKWGPKSPPFVFLTYRSKMAAYSVTDKYWINVIQHVFVLV